MTALHRIRKTGVIFVKRTFEKIITLASENGIEYVAEGSNMDDNGDYRPGLIAVAELEVKSPPVPAK